jgi:phosphoketolase
MTVSAIASADHWLRSHDYMNVIVAGKPTSP